MAQEKNLFAGLIKNAFAGIGVKPKKQAIPKLVIAINQVDNLATPEAPWISEINLPSRQLEEIIQKRVEDIINKLSKQRNIQSGLLTQNVLLLRVY